MAEAEGLVTDIDLYQAARQKLIQQVKAAMIMTAAGLACDADWHAEDMRNCTSIRIDISHNPLTRPIHAYGGSSGFFKDLVRQLLARWTIPAPAPEGADEVIREHGWAHIYVEGPGRSVSSHQIIEAGALLTRTLTELGYPADKVTEMLELRP